MGIKIGNSPESWGVISPDDPSRTPWHRFLGEVAEAGYEWTELGPYGYLPTDPSTLRSELDARGLKVTAGALLTPLEEPSALAGVGGARAADGRASGIHGRRDLPDSR